MRASAARCQLQNGREPVRVEYAPKAQRDIEDIVAYIAEDDPVAADAWVSRLMARAALAAATPRAGRVVPEWEDKTIREVFVRTYRIIYRIDPKRILVLRVLEGHKLLRGGRKA